MTTQAILQVKGFSKQFNLHELDKVIPSSSEVTFNVYAGQLTALIGPTGAGKSSVLKGIYRTYLPSSGSIIYQCANGRSLDLAMADEHQILDLRQQEIGFVTQFLHALPRQSTEDVVAQPFYQRGVSREQGRIKARELLAQLNIPERLWTVPPATFSGGEQQRVNLARGLISKPRLLLLDEPTSSLDPATSDRVIEMIQSMKAEGTAMLAIFHHPDLVERLADKVVTLTPPILTNTQKVA
jgi:alpha-D-ribose 1-methylphosphonate 5-triphosphate synthase subunit PhnL